MGWWASTTAVAGVVVTRQPIDPEVGHTGRRLVGLVGLALALGACTPGTSGTSPHTDTPGTLDTAEVPGTDAPTAHDTERPSDPTSLCPPVPGRLTDCAFLDLNGLAPPMSVLDDTILELVGTVEVPTEARSERTLELAFLSGADAAAGDLDGDGLPDLALSKMLGPVVVLHNDGGLRFHTLPFLPEPVWSNHALIADLVRQEEDRWVLGGDGRPDLVLVSVGDSEAEHDLLRASLRAALAARLDDEPAPALAQPPPRLRIFANVDGTRGLEVSDAVGLGAPVTCAAGGTPRVAGLELAFLDQDPWPDLILRQDGQPGREACATPVWFGSPTGFRKDAAWMPRLESGGALLVHDLDRDGRKDLISADFGGNRSGIWQRTATGWRDVSSAPLVTGGGDLMGAALGDGDGDGDLDLRLTDLYRQHLLLRPASDALDFFAAAQARQARSDWNLWHDPDETRLDSGSVTWATAFVDLDGDGAPELVDVGGLEHLSPTIPQHLYIHRRNPDTGMFEPRHGVWTDPKTPHHERGLVVEDFDGDGCPDLLPLPMGPSPWRIIVNGVCTPGTLRRLQLRTPAGFAAVGSRLVASFAGGQAAWCNTGSGGASGHVAGASTWLRADTTEARVRFSHDRSEASLRAPLPEVWVP